MSTCYGPTIKWPLFSVLLAPSISPTPLVLKSQPVASSKLIIYPNVIRAPSRSLTHQDSQSSNSKQCHCLYLKNFYVTKSCPGSSNIPCRFGNHQVAKNADMSFFNFYHPISCRPLLDPQSPKILNNLKASIAAVSLFKSFQSSSRK